MPLLSSQTMAFAYSFSSDVLGFAFNHHLPGSSYYPPRNGHRHRFLPVPSLRRPLSAARWHLPQSSPAATSPANLPSPLPAVDFLVSTSQPVSTPSLDEEFACLAARDISPPELTMLLKREPDWRRALRLFRWARARPGYEPNSIHYNVMLRVLGLAGEWDELRRCWVAMARDGLLPTNYDYAVLIDVYDKAGLRREALLWLRHMRARGVVPDEVTMNTVVGVLKDSGRFASAERFFRLWCEGRIDLDALDWEGEGETDASSLDTGVFSPKQFILTELFRSGGRPPVSSKSLAELEPRKPRLADTYNTLIDLYGKAGRLNAASDAFSEMLRSGIMPDTTTFNTMIHVCGTNGNLVEADALLSKMEERRVPPDTKTFNIFMSLYSSAGNLDAVMKYYRRIAEARLKPDNVTHRIILQELCKRHMVAEAEKVIKELENSCTLVDEQSLPVVVKMYTDGGLLEQGKKFLQKHCFGRAISSSNYAAIINAYAERGFWMEAEDVFYRKHPGSKKDVVEYNVMVKVYGKAKLYDKAIQLFESMARSGVLPDSCTYNSMIQMLAGAMMPEKARELLFKMQQVGYTPHCESFSATIESFTRANLPAEAEDIFNEMKGLGVEPNEVVYGSLINALAESGKVEDALQYFRLMKRSGVTVNQVILTSLIKGFGKLGCWEEACELYEKMKDLEGGPDIIASNCMIKLFAELGMVAKAERIFIDLRERGHADEITYATMMHYYKGMGMLNEVVEVARMMQSAGLLNDCSSFNRVLAAYAACGMHRECAELIHQMQYQQKILPDENTFKIIFTILRKGSISCEAITQLQESYYDGKPYCRQAILTCLFAVLGMQDLANEYCAAFLKSEVKLDIFAYNVAIFMYGTYGRIDDAFNMLLRMQDKGHLPDVVTYINLAHCYCKAGMVEGLRSIYGKLKYGEIDPNVSLFHALINACKSLGKLNLAALIDQEMRYSLNEQEDSDEDMEMCRSLNTQEDSDVDEDSDADMETCR